MSRRALGAMLLVGFTVLGPATVAQADPAKPSNARSHVLSVDPPVAGLQVDIVGGDGFVRVRAARGLEVMVLGYAGEPYVEIQADGTVRENQRSPAVGINRRRDASSSPQAGADSGAPPEWKLVGHNGSYLWHDHRVHYMGDGTPPALSPWDVTLAVNGQSVMVHGELRQLSSPTSWPWKAVAVVAGVATLAGLLRYPRWTSLVLAVVGVAAIVVGFSEVLHLPSLAQPGPRSWALPLAALVLVALGLMSWSPLLPLRRPALVGAGGVLSVWAYQRRSALTRRLLITGLPNWLERSIVAITLGVAVAATIAMVAAIFLAYSSPNQAGARSRR